MGRLHRLLDHCYQVHRQGVQVNFITQVITEGFQRAGRKYDAARTIAEFNTTIRDEVDLNQLCTKLVAVANETMQPAHVSLWLCPPTRYSEKTTRVLPLIK
jgi:hypothetical protein